MGNTDDHELEILEKAQGITLEDGLEYCGNSRALLKFLGTFLRSIDSKSAEIEDSCNRADIEFFTIKVHALKSTSRIIGAKELSDMALKLEHAGKDNDLDYIKEHTPDLLELYRSYKEKLGVIGEKKEEDYRTDISAKELQDAYAALEEAIPDMEYDAVESILGELSTYKLPESDQNKIDRLSDLLKQMDWDAMEELMKEV